MAQQRELLCKLLDIYGMALSSRCRDVLEYYYADALSLAEISENMGITRQGVHDAIRRGEAELLAFSAKLLTYECGIRFLTDYLNGDTYFKIHRENHNLDRARTQFTLVRRMEEKWDEMMEIIAKIG